MVSWTMIPFLGLVLSIQARLAASSLVPQTGEFGSVSSEKQQPGVRGLGWRDEELLPKNHYDARFAKRELSSPQRHTALENLVRTYLATLDDLGIETWLMHRALLGWWWGKHVLPSDLDLSVQVSEPAIFFLAAYYNMSTFSSKSADTSHRRRYLLELSPYAKDREHRDWSNAADARWIDTESGLSIDVYAVRYNLTHPGGEGMLSCKDGSEIKDTYLFPLRNTTFEGVPAKIPYRYEELLVIEYGADALKEIGHNDYHFDHDDMRWVLKEKLPANAEGSQKTVNHVGAGEL